MRRVALALGCLLLSACGSGDSAAPGTAARGEQTSAATEARDESAAPVHWRDVQHGFAVTYPDTWRRASSRLTPYLDDPLEILALGTYELRAGGDRCAHQPVHAVEDLGPRDALIVVFERAPPFPASGYSPRVGRPELAADTNRFCVPNPSRLDSWSSFGEHGRAFYVLMALGEDALDETRRQLYEIYESLVFDPR